MKATQTAQHTQAMVDGLGSGLGLFIELIANISEQRRFLDVERVGYGMGYAPACEMQQIVCIGAQGTERELAKALGIEKLIGPSDFLPLVIDQMIGTDAGWCGRRMDERDGHND